MPRSRSSPRIWFVHWPAVRRITHRSRTRCQRLQVEFASSRLTGTNRILGRPDRLSQSLSAATMVVVLVRSRTGLTYCPRRMEPHFVACSRKARPQERGTAARLACQCNSTFRFAVKWQQLSPRKPLPHLDLTALVHAYHMKRRLP